MDNYQLPNELAGLANWWAKYAASHLSKVHRGVIRGDYPPHSCVLFGNDGFGVVEDGRALREVALLRRILKAAQIAELGFAVHEEYSWAMLVDTDRFVVLRAVLDAVWAAVDQNAAIDTSEVATWLT